MFTFTLFLLTDVLPRHKYRWPEGEWERLDATCQKFLDRSLRGMVFSVQHMKWDRVAENDYFWDAAAASRQLWHAYRNHDCLARPQRGFDRFMHLDEGGLNCFHRRRSRLLVHLHAQAYKETRHKVFLAAGKRLPAELADHLLEFACAAEEIPCTPMISEKGKGLGFETCVKQRHWPDYPIRTITEPQNDGFKWTFVNYSPENPDSEDTADRSGPNAGKQYFVPYSDDGRFDFSHADACRRTAADYAPNVTHLVGNF